MSQENVARADLRPVTASQLKGSASQKGTLLTVTDPKGDAVVRATLGNAVVKPAHAVVEAAEGKWHIVQTDRRELVAHDLSTRAIATIRTGEVVLADGRPSPGSTELRTPALSPRR